MKFLSVLILLIFVSMSQADPMDAGCFFLRDGRVQPPSTLKSVRVAEFLIYANDLTLVSRHREIIERSAHFLQTELGWKFPFTRKELSRPVLEVYLIPARAGFTGTVRPGPAIVLNENVLKSGDFGAHWIHHLAHASALMYRSLGTAGLQDSWFYEATAGWME